MPFGIQRIASGIVASVARPPASSAMLHSAIACTLPIWLRTARRSRMRTTQRPGSSPSPCGVIESQYDARRHTSRENSQRPGVEPPRRRNSFNAGDAIGQRSGDRAQCALVFLPRARAEFGCVEVVDRNELERRLAHAREQVAFGAAED